MQNDKNKLYITYKQWEALLKCTNLNCRGYSQNSGFRPWSTHYLQTYWKSLFIVTNLQKKLVQLYCIG